MITTPCWVAVLAQDLVEAACRGGYIEINQGRAGPLERMHAGDPLACYAPRLTHPKGSALQAFTAIGRVQGPVVQELAGHQPFRRAVAWLPCQPAPIRPLLESLGFIRNPAHWGASFRFGFLRVPPEDFLTIARAMRCDIDLASPASVQAPPQAAVRGGRPRRVAASAP